jgi:hypothetical protein
VTALIVTPTLDELSSVKDVQNFVDYSSRSVFEQMERQGSIEHSGRRS